MENKRIALTSFIGSLLISSAFVAGETLGESSEKENSVKILNVINSGISSEDIGKDTFAGDLTDQEIANKAVNIVDRASGDTTGVRKDVMNILGEK